MSAMFSHRRLFKQTSILYFPKLISWVGSYLAFSLLFRVRGAAEYGDLTLLTAYWGVPAILAGDIIGSSCQRLLAHEGTVGGSRLKRAFQSVWTIHFLTLLLVGFLGVALMPMINPLIFKSAAVGEHVVLGLVIFIGTASLSFFRYVLRGMQLFRQTLAMDMTESLTRNMLWIACCTGYLGGVSLAQAAGCALITAAVVIYLALMCLGYYPSRQKVESSFAREVGHQAKSFSVIFLCNYLLYSLPTILLNRYHGSEAVGLYSALFKVADFSTGPIVALAYILTPAATGAKLKGEGEVRSLLTRSFKLSIFFLPLIFAMVISRSEIVNLFGLGKYPEAPGVLLAFCVFVLFANISAIFGTFTDFLGYARARSRIMLFFTLLFGVSGWFLAKNASILEIAWGTSFAFGCMVSCYLMLIVYHHSAQFIRENLSLLIRVFIGLVAAAVLARYGLSAPEAPGFRANFISLLIRSLSFFALVAFFGAPLVLRRDQGRFVIR